MIGMTIGGVLNIILDPIMIFGMNMGVVGAAIATVLGNVGAVLFYLWYMIFKSKNLSISPKYMIPDGFELRNILLIGIPASLNTMLMCISNIIENNLAANHGALELSSIGVILRDQYVPGLYPHWLGTRCSAAHRLQLFRKQSEAVRQAL